MHQLPAARTQLTVNAVHQQRQVGSVGAQAQRIRQPALPQKAGAMICLTTWHDKIVAAEGGGDGLFSYMA